MNILTLIATLLGQVLKAVLPDLIREWKQPRKTRYIGGNEELISAVEDSIRESVEADE